MHYSPCCSKATQGRKRKRKGGIHKSYTPTLGWYCWQTGIGLVICVAIPRLWSIRFGSMGRVLCDDLRACGGTRSDRDCRSENLRAGVGRTKNRKLSVTNLHFIAASGSFGLIPHTSSTRADLHKWSEPLCVPIGPPSHVLYLHLVFRTMTGLSQYIRMFGSDYVQVNSISFQSLWNPSTLDRWLSTYRRLLYSLSLRLARRPVFSLWSLFASSSNFSRVVTDML